MIESKTMPDAGKAVISTSAIHPFGEAGWVYDNAALQQDASLWN